MRCLTFLTVFALGLTTNCGDDQNGDDQNSDDQNSDDQINSLTFAWIPKERNNEVFDTGLSRAKKKAQELTGNTNHLVKIKHLGTATAADIDGQVALLNQAVAERVDGIGISCSAPGGKIKKAIDAAVEAGIPVMTWDSDAEESRRFTYFGLNNREGGIEAATILGKSMANMDNNKVIILSGTKTAANLQERIKGFVNKLKKDYGDLEILDLDDDTSEYAVALYCDDVPILGAALIERAIAKHPDIGGVFMAGLWPLEVFEGDAEREDVMPLWGARAREGKIKTVAFDTLPFQLDFVGEDMVQGLIGQKYWDWGYETVQMLYDKVVERADFENKTYSESEVVCKNNLAEMKRMWIERDFYPGLEEKCDLLD